MVRSRSGNGEGGRLQPGAGGVLGWGMANGLVGHWAPSLDGEGLAPESVSTFLVGN